MSTHTKEARIWRTTQRVIQENQNLLKEESTLYIYRADTNQVLTRNIQELENAKAATKEIRKNSNRNGKRLKLKPNGRQSRATISIKQMPAEKRIRFNKILSMNNRKAGIFVST